MSLVDIKLFKEKATKAKMSEEGYFLNISLLAEIENVKNSLQKKLVNWLKQSTLHTTVGGSATEEVLMKAQASDVCLVTLRVAGAAPVTISSSRCEDGKVVIEFSGDPSSDHQVNIIVI